MKILFITGLYPNELYEDLRDRAYGVLQNAPNVFQWSIVEGLVNNEIDFNVVSLPFLPEWPHGYKSLYTPLYDIKYQGKKIGRMVPYCNLVVYKTFSVRVRLQWYIEQWIKDNRGEDNDLVILTYTPYFPYIKAAVNAIKDISGITIASIVTDLVDDMLNFESNRKLLKRVQCYKESRQTKSLYKHIDKFILLSKYMTEKIPSALERHIVIEGISVEKPFPNGLDKSEYKTILYTGALQHYAGVSDLIKAFSKIKDDDCRLIICGSGPLATMALDYAETDKRIIYMGLVSHDESLKLQRSATVLINPRKPDCDITKYSFPSKTMEYLSSGTPMIGYKLAGIPEEYFKYYYTIDEMTEDALIEKIKNVLALNKEELEQKAREAYHFIMREKVAKVQVKKIVDFLKQ